MAQASSVMNEPSDLDRRHTALQGSLLIQGKPDVYER